MSPRSLLCNLRARTRLSGFACWRNLGVRSGFARAVGILSCFLRWLRSPPGSNHQLGLVWSWQRDELTKVRPSTDMRTRYKTCGRSNVGPMACSRIRAPPQNPNTATRASATVHNSIQWLQWANSSVVWGGWGGKMYVQQGQTGGGDDPKKWKIFRHSRGMGIAACAMRSGLVWVPSGGRQPVTGSDGGIPALERGLILELRPPLATSVGPWMRPSPIGLPREENSLICY